MTDLSYTSFEIPLANPLQTASGSIDTRRGFVVRYGDGLGEATPLSGWTETPKATEEALEAAGEHVPGAPSRGLLACDDAPAARHGLSQAMLDYHARRRGLPLYRYLGASEPIHTVTVNAILDETPVDALTTQASQAIADGFRTLKLKVGRGPIDHDIERLRQLRRTVGDEIELRADANGSWSTANAVGVCRQVRELDLAYIEQPTSVHDTANLGVLAETGVPIALDETIAAGEVLTALRSPVTAIIIKPMAVGGIDRALAIAKATRQCGKLPVISDLITGAVGRAGAIHLAAVVNAATAHGLATGSRLDGDLVEGVGAVTNGCVSVPSGLGIGLDTEVFRR